MILITGASGTVGSEVLKQAVAARLNIRAAYTSSGKAKAAPAGVETVLMDYARPESIRAALNGIEKVFLVGPPAPNVAELEAQFVDEAKNSGVKHIVKLSAMGGRSAIFPGLHRDSEEHIEASDVPWTFLRPNGFMQNDLAWAAQLPGGAVAVPVADAAWTIVDVRDVAAVAAAALRDPDRYAGRALHLTGPEARSPRSRVAALAAHLGRDVAVVDVPVAAHVAQLRGYGVPEWVADGLGELLELYATGAAEAVLPDVEEVLGRPAGTWERFVADHATAWRG